MTLDVRTRRSEDIRALGRDEIFDAVLPDAIRVHGDLAARGLTYQELPPLGLDVDGSGVTLDGAPRPLVLRPGAGSGGVAAVLSADALSDLLQDVVSTMGLAMTSRVKIVSGGINDWSGWGRRVVSR